VPNCYQRIIPISNGDGGMLCGRSELEERFRLLEHQELDGPLGGLGQNGRHDALPVRGDALMAVHLGEAVEHAIVVQLESGDISSVNCFRKGGKG